MSYTKFGIRPELVERVKQKIKKNPPMKERIKLLVSDVNKQDLQDSAKVRKLVKSGAAIVKEPLSEAQQEQIVAFILEQRIDPKNTFHLIKLWGLFR